MKVALVAFNGELMCFVHVLLNGLDMAQGGLDVKIVIEGSATKLIPELTEEGAPMSGLFAQAREKGLIDAVCRACSSKMGVLDVIEAQGLPLVDEMSGHPSLARYLKEGYRIITF